MPFESMPDPNSETDTKLKAKLDRSEKNHFESITLLTTLPLYRRNSIQKVKKNPNPPDLRAADINVL
jgi:hypothetical protein